jgi:DNA repair protein RadC
MKTIKKIILKYKRIPIPDPQVAESVGVYVKCSTDICRIATSLLRDEIVESFLIFMMDKNKIIGVHEAGRGSVDECPFQISDVFRAIFISGATAFAVAHNHPDGDPQPSTEDVSISRKLKEAGELLGVKLLDSVIVGDQKYFSLLDRGLLESNAYNIKMHFLNMLAQQSLVKSLVKEE